MRRLLLTFAAFFVLITPANADWTWPVSGDVITPYRNGTDPYATGQHRGIDIAAPVGTVVRAASAGEVRFAGTAGSSGQTISIRTGDGYDASYLHLSSLDVRAGAHVSAGDRIGAVGTTGTRSATAPHLHFGVRDAGTRHAYHDPLAFLPPAPPASPAPEPPVPEPAPLPSSPPPAPVPVPAPSPVAGRSPIPHAAPAPRAAPHQRGLPRAVSRPFRAPAPSPHSGGAPLERPGYEASQRPGRTGAERTPQGRPAHGAPPARSPAIERADLNRRMARPASAEAETAGPDLGWVLACAGLLLVAAVLGLTEDGRRATTRTRAKLVAPFARG